MPVLALVMSIVLSISRKTNVGDPLAAADDGQANILLQERRPLLDQILLEKVHEEVELAAAASSFRWTGSRE